MLPVRLLRQSIFVGLLVLLPQLSESCMSCFHPKVVTPSHNTHQHSHAIAVAASGRMGPYNTGAAANSLAIVTTAAQQLFNLCKERCLTLRESFCTIPAYSRSIRLSASAALVTCGMITIARHHMPINTKQGLYRRLWRNQLADDTDNETTQDGDSQADSDTKPPIEKEEPVMTSAMVATIGIYKNWISPLLPPACRFVPTCSQYGVQAIKEFGPSKGAILTSWRLLRCTPFGGKGYDPPKWPPVSYTYSSY